MLTELERIAALEAYRELHAEHHRLEERAVDTVRDDLKDRLEELNNVRQRFLDKDLFEKVHSILDARVSKLELAGSSSPGERGLLKYAWQAALLGTGWLIRHLMWK